MNVHEYVFSELYSVLTNADLIKVHFIHECTPCTSPGPQNSNETQTE